MRRFLLSFVLFPFAAQAQITSTFDTDADGWTFSNNGTPVTVNHNASNGNPGGFVATAPYSSNSTATSQGWFAPANFLGLHAARSFGMNLRFDLQQSVAGTSSSTQGDVRIITTGGFLIVYSLPVKPAVAPAWSSYTIKLDETVGWRVGNTGGALATRADIIRVLSNITTLEIRGTYVTNASYISGLDNVVLEQKTLDIAPTVSSLSVAFGKPGDVITINGTGFNTATVNNTVRFGNGGIKAVVQSASSTQLTIVVPQNASYGPIVVTNTTTGLITTTDPFTPVFDGGGRIIPASFKPKFDIPTIQIESIAAADVDGDGWNDLVVTNDFTDRVIDIYRNLGAGGTLSASSFDAKVSITYTGVSSNNTGLWFADLDGDGKPDAITSTATAGFIGVYVTFRNTSTPGNISFEAPEYWRGGTDESPIKYIGDLDGDGRPDFVSGEGAIPGAFWFNQNLSMPGDIEIGGAVAPFALTVINGFTNATAGDLNGDGKPDLIITNGQGQAIDVLQNASTPGTPTFTEAFQFTTNQYTNEPILVADMNLDGKNDLLYKTSGEAGFHIRLNTDTDGTLTAADFATDVIMTGDLSNGGIGGITIADMNGDGRPDIVASDNTDFGVYENVFFGGVFDVTSLVPAYQYEAPGLNTAPTVPVAVDLNGDGKPEIIAGITNAASPDAFTIYENLNIAAPLISLTTVSPLAGPVGSTVTITGNNFSTVPAENIVWFGSVQATVVTATASQLTVAVPPGAGYAPVSVTKSELTSTYHLPFQTTFSSGVIFDNAQFAAPVNITLAGALYDIAVGDLDNDGKPDIVAEGGSNLTSRFLNTHSSGLIAPASLTLSGTSTTIRSPRLQDLDGDGKLDLMGVSTISRNNSTPGNISFLTNISLPVDQLGLTAFSDVNLDGKTDILIVEQSVAANIIENQTANLSGNFTTGTFASFQRSFITRPTSRGSVVGADFDNDGYADMITSNFTLDNISIYKNAKRYRANATSFETSVELNVGDNPQRMYTGDFDRDGKLDVLVLHGAGTTSTLLVLLQNTSTVGNISFSRIDLTNPSASTTATVADLDGDGKPEIITTSETGNQFSIFKNIHTSGALTAASFAAPFNTTVTAPRGITTGDLNLDGKPEIILTRAAGILVVYENSISSFSPPTITSFTPASGAVGTTVIITGTNFSTTLANNIVYFGATQATVTAATSTQLTVTVPTGASFKPITVSVNGLTAYASKPFIVSFAGGAPIDNCSFAPPIDIGSVSTSSFSTALCDLDGDGKIDLLIPEFSSNQLAIFRNTSVTGTPSFAPRIPFTGLTQPIAPAVGDLDGDGKPDIAVANYTDGQLSVYKNLSTPGTISVATRVTYSIPAFTSEVSIADIDGDGKQDLIISASIQGLIVMRNQGSPGVIDATTFAAGVTFATGANAYPVALGDLDGDGKLDAIVPNANTYTLSVLRNTSTPGVVSFAAPLTLTTNTGTPTAGFGTGYVSLGDVDGDGKQDIVAVSNTVTKLSLFRNTSTPGALTFDPRFDIATTGIGAAPPLSDLNGDGKLDLVADNGSLQMLVFENTATPGVINAASFKTPIVLTRASAYIPQLGDVDGDGRNDIISTSTNVQVFRNLVGTISPPTITSFTPTVGSVGSFVIINGTNFSTPFSLDVKFNGTTAAILDNTGSSIQTEVPVGATTGPIQVTIGCNSVTSSGNFTIGTPATITITQQPTSPFYACEGGSASFTTAASGTTNITYQWQKFDGSVFVDLVNNTTYSGVTSATLSISNVSSSESGEYQCVISGDFATDVITDVADLVFNSLPSPPDVVNGVSCGPGVVTLTATGGSPGDYRWYSGSPLTLIAGEQNGTFVTPSLSANTTYYVSLAGTFCESIPVAVTAIISSPPAQPAITSSVTPTGNEITICSTTSLTLTAPNGFADYLWSDGSTTQTITVAASGTYTVVVSNADGCASPASNGLLVTLLPAPCTNAPPVIATTSVSTTIGNSVSLDLTSLISDPDNNLVVGSLTIVQQPASGAVATLNGTTLQIDYSGLSFSGMDEVAIRICDLFGECTSQTIQILVIGEIEIYNAVSPNNDGKNDFFKIAFIADLEPENTVTIFNRWGSKVFETENYTESNSFRGLSQNGNELPSGTYFYEIIFKSSGKKESGYLVLKR